MYIDVHTYILSFIIKGSSEPMVLYPYYSMICYSLLLLCTSLIGNVNVIDGVLYVNALEIVVGRKPAIDLL